jgi:hypothetical protein
VKPYTRPMCDCGNGACPSYKSLRDAYDTKQRLEDACDRAGTRWLDELDAYNTHLRKIAREAERRAA